VNHRHSLSRRRLLALGGLAGAGLTTGCAGMGRRSPALGDTAAGRRVPDASGEWWLPTADGPRPTVVLVHGGYWQPGYDRHLEDRLAADLRGRGYLVWNIDYRPASAGWPQTLLSAGAAYDDLLTGRYADRVDRHRVAVVGHSAGGQLALWLASRHRLPRGAPGAPNGRWLRPTLVVGQAAVAALIPAAREQLGGGAVAELCGGSPTSRPERYAVADPVELAPASGPAVLIHGRADDVVPLSQSTAYERAARATGAPIELHVVPGGHFEHLDPGSVACHVLRRTLTQHLR